MKKAQKALLLVLCGALCAVILTCTSSGGGGGGGGGSAGEVIPGNWTWVAYTASDKDDGDTSTCVLVEADEVIDGETVHTYSLSGTVTDAKLYGLAECHIDPDEETRANLRAAKAISFKIQGDGKRYMIEAPIKAVTDWGYHVYNITTTSEPQEIVIQMRMFLQPAWAQPVLFSQKQVEKIIFKTKNNAEGGLGDFKVKLWDLKLIM